MFQYLIYTGYNYFKQDPVSRDPILGCMCLLLTCQYEAAILYLYNVRGYRVHAVYLAMAMLKQGLIQDSEMIPKHRPRVSHTSNPTLPSIDFTSYLNTPIHMASLIEEYVWGSKFFRNPSLDQSISYDYEKCLFVFLANKEVRNIQGQSLFDEKVAAFVLKYKCYDELFGNYQLNVCELNHRLRSLSKTDFSSNTYSRYFCLSPHPLICKVNEYLPEGPQCACGVNHLTTRYNKFGLDEDLDDLETYLTELNFGSVAFRDGILYRLLDGDEEKFKETVQVAANEAVACGMEHDAIRLNTICGNLNVALKLMNIELGFYFNKNLKCEARKTCIRLADGLFNMLPYYSKADESDARAIIRSFLILTSCCSVYESYVTGSYEKALRRIEKMDIIPRDVQDVDIKNEEFQKYDVCVKNAIGTIIQIMTDIHEHMLQAACLGLMDQNKSNQLQLKRRNNAVMLFTSSNRNWFNNEETNRKLLEINSRLEAFSL